MFVALAVNSHLPSTQEQPAAVTDSIKLFQRRMFSPLAAKLGWSFDDKKESFLTGQLRTLAIASAGKAGDPSVINEAQSRFKSFLAGDKQVIHPNLRGAVFSIVLREGGVEAYEAVLRLYQETTIADQKLIALSALGSTRDPALLQRTLDFSMSEGVRPQDIIYVFGTVASNPKGRTMAWEFVQKHWAALEERYYKGSMSLLGRIVSSTTDSFSSTAWFEQVKAFFGIMMACHLVAVYQVIHFIHRTSSRQGLACNQSLDPTKSGKNLHECQVCRS